MTMPPFPLLCYRPECGKQAIYKVASVWSDGQTQELKHYGLCCPDCLEALYRRSLTRQPACRLTVGETLGPPGIFVLVRGQRDRQLERREDLERQLGARDAGPT
jgi:hypothetical protein